jgi:regulator of protease activity HflC (stomatin/prohibitin superfamily)
MEGHLRGIIGQLSVEQLVKEPEFVGDRVRATCADDMTKMGLEVISFTIKEIRDKNEYITNMGRPDISRIKARRGNRHGRSRARYRHQTRGRGSRRSGRQGASRTGAGARPKRFPPRSRPNRSAILKSRRRSIRKP